MELTKQQIKRQDFVDNAIFDLINELIPSGKEMGWDIKDFPNAYHLYENAEVSARNKSFILISKNNGDTRETNRGHSGEFANADAKDIRTGRGAEAYRTSNHRSIWQARHALYLPERPVSHRIEGSKLPETFHQAGA